MRLRLRSPRQLAKTLLAAARRDQTRVVGYLQAKSEEWGALAGAAPGDAADILEQLDQEQAAGLIADLGPPEAAEVLEEIAPELAAELIDEVPLMDLAAALNEWLPADLADHQVHA